MTKQINILAGRSVSGGSGLGIMTSANNPWTVSDGLADELVNRKVATYVTAPTPTQYGTPFWADSSGTKLVRPDGSSVTLGVGLGSTVTVEDISAGPYTLKYVSDTDNDLNKIKRWNTNSALTFNLPDTVTGNTLFPVGFQAEVFVDAGGGAITFAPLGSATIVSKNGTFTTNGIKSTVLITLIAPNEWRIEGALGSLSSADLSDFNAAVDARIAAAGVGGGLSWAEPGSYANLPLLGAAGTATFGVHSGSFTVIGTAAAATTSLNGKGFKRRQKITASAAAADTGAGVRSSTTGVAYAPNASNAEKLRGEFFQGSADALTNCRGAMGVGWFGGSAPSMATEPTAFTNCVMLAYTSTDTQWKLMINDGSGAVTPVALNGGAGFPCNGNETDYVRFYYKFNGGSTRSIDWVASNLITGVSVTGNVTADIPAEDQQLMAFNYRSSAANTSAACAMNYGGCLGGAACGS